jgi:hypothetical protein
MPAPRKPKLDLAAEGAHVVSVFGTPTSRRVLVEIPLRVAEGLFPDSIPSAARPNAIDAAEREVEALRDRDPSLADGALAASAVAMAYEMANPYNSATSKSMCAREMRDTLDRLRALAPPAQKRDGIDALGDELAARRADVADGGARAAN